MISHQQRLKLCWGLAEKKIFQVEQGRLNHLGLLGRALSKAAVPVSRANSTGISQVWATQTSSPVKISHLQKHKDVLSKDNLWEKRVVLFMEGLTSGTAAFSLSFI